MIRNRQLHTALWWRELTEQEREAVRYYTPYGYGHTLIDAQFARYDGGVVNLNDHRLVAIDDMTVVWEFSLNRPPHSVYLFRILGNDQVEMAIEE